MADKKLTYPKNKIQYKYQIFDTRTNVCEIISPSPVHCDKCFVSSFANTTPYSLHTNLI